MIKVDKVEDGLPISVIIPLSHKRKPFFHDFVMPMLEANNPIEIIINDNEGTAPKKRNDGFKKATQPFVFFCDDDIVLPASYLQTLYSALKNNNNAGFAYTGYYGIVLHPESHPIHNNFQIPSMPFNATVLRQYNYISTMSLIRTDVFPMFDENLKRLQDWDIFLTLLGKGITGIFIKDLKFFAYYIDEGITSNTNSEIDAILAIRTKHNL
jgi:glycosyltransferase involved in cell wall biosynthesis